MITAGGVTSGIDFGLTLVSEVAGRQAAQTIQLALEYNPGAVRNSQSCGGGSRITVGQLASGLSPYQSATRAFTNQSQSQQHITMVGEKMNAQNTSR